MFNTSFLITEQQELCAEVAAVCEVPVLPGRQSPELNVPSYYMFLIVRCLVTHFECMNISFYFFQEFFPDLSVSETD